jgi:hypothetical protein
MYSTVSEETAAFSALKMDTTDYSEMFVPNYTVLYPKIPIIFVINYCQRNEKFSPSKFIIHISRRL